MGVEPVLNSTDYQRVVNVGRLRKQDFTDYKTISERRYITAKLSNVDREFEVGNGERVGGYYNYPLTKGDKYVLYYGVEVTRGQVR